MISKNRVILGVGAGWYKNEFAAFGVNFENHRTRTEMLNEALRLLRLVWKAEGPVDYRGKYYTVLGARLKPGTNLPPIWLGGASKAVLQSVAAHADGWVPYELGAEEYSRKSAKISDLLENLGRKKSSVRMALATRVVPSETEEQAVEELRRIGIKRDYETPTGRKGHIIAGSYENCAEELSRYVDRGVKYLVLSPQPPERSTELLQVLQDKVLSRL